jgi:UDP-N-acetylmuramoylalanine--D-glutamate ligase
VGLAGLPPEWMGGEVAVIGLGRSGLAVARALAGRGARVYASDGAETERTIAAAGLLEPDGVSVELGRHDLGRIAAACVVVASPGVDPGAPPIATPLAAGRPVIGEIEVALRLAPGLRYIAVTGTNGKSTTTELIAHLLRGIGGDAVAAGNIGTPLIDVVDAPPRWVALELSSFQLHDTPSVDPAVGVLTNLSPNHLDRYPSLDAYYADKALLFRNASERSRWVLNADDDAVLRMTSKLAGEIRRFSLRSRNADAFLRDGDLVVGGERIASRSDLPLLGEHNAANALAAMLAVSMATGETPATHSEAFRMALRSFEPLEHRIEPVTEYGGVLWINDSKSTSVAATAVALRGMDRPTILLLGGRHKGESYQSLEPELRRTVRHVLAFGEARGEIARDLRGKVAVEALESDLEGVVQRARELASPGDAVLLSPACSSYDMFRNYEERGAEFKRLAVELRPSHLSGRR